MSYLSLSDVDGGERCRRATVGRHLLQAGRSCPTEDDRACREPHAECKPAGNDLVGERHGIAAGGSAIFFSSPSLVKNATDCPSGEKNGWCARNVPGRSRIVRLSSERTRS